jgi:hypothetical protein
MIGEGSRNDGRNAGDGDHREGGRGSGEAIDHYISSWSATTSGCSLL